MAEFWFSKAEKQGAKITAMLQKESAISSVRTYDNYKQSLTHVAQYLKDEKLPSINNLTPELATQYLQERATEVGQKMLDMERQAMQAVMQRVNHKLPLGKTLQVVKSEREQVLVSRSYTPEQVKLISQHQTEKHALATEIAHAAGLRAHELLTIRPTTERAPDAREAHSGKFEGRMGQSYTVVGKGGLAREIRIPDALSQRLEATRLSEAQKVTDRTVHYMQHYNISGGQKWSNSFSQASKRVLGWSNGAHGLRHSYAQGRMSELQNNHPYQESLRIVSQEMGHFRPEITEVYLR